MNTLEKKEHEEAKDKKKVPKNERRCEICGGPITYLNITRHLKTKKHIDSVYIQFQKFEIL